MRQGESGTELRRLLNARMVPETPNFHVCMVSTERYYETVRGRRPAHGARYCGVAPHAPERQVPPVTHK